MFLARFGKYDLALDIPISWVDLTETSSFPVLAVTDTVDYLVKSKNLPKLFGDKPVEGVQDTLLEFWRRYALECPDFPIFSASMEGKISLRRSIPVYIHGDEGRGFKRSGVMILSLQGAVGKGTRPFERKHRLQSVRNIKMGVNLAGSSFNSRFLFTAMPKKYYSSKPEPRQLGLINNLQFVFSFHYVSWRFFKTHGPTSHSLSQKPVCPTPRIIFRPYSTR